MHQGKINSAGRSIRAKFWNTVSTVERSTQHKMVGRNWLVLFPFLKNNNIFFTFTENMQKKLQARWLGAHVSSLNNTALVSLF